MVVADNIVEGDLRVIAGKIASVAPGGGLVPRDDELVIDGEGLHLLPGAIDPHVHFREPGQPEKEDLESGSRAAAAGGVTAFLDMPNNIPNATNHATLEAKIALADQKAVTHHGFFVGATKDNVSDLQRVEGMDGVCGIKIFMGSSTGDLLVHEQKHLEDIFANTGG
ncbi:MAG TPA: dihydroorotase, partial [Candidatus Poseidoniales archaeon]